MALIGLAAAILIARSSWFFKLPFGNKFLQNEDYSYTLSGANCGVVIFGDSTAITGLNPDLISSMTGLKTCNISEPIGVLTVTGPKALDDYLSRNAPPKYIIFQFAAENYVHRITDWNKVIYTEGVLQLVRHHLDGRAAWLLMRHPKQTIESLSWIWMMAIDGAYRKLIGREQRWTGLHDGYFSIPTAPQKTCRGNPVEEAAIWESKAQGPKDTWVTEWRRKYSRNGTRVIFNSSPVPNCDSHYEYLARYAPAATDNQLEKYPIHEFNDSDRHFTVAGANRLSAEIAREIQDLGAQASSREILSASRR